MSDRPYLFLFPGMGGYDPHLIKVGAACKEAVRAVQIAYLHWTVLLRHPEFDFETLISDILKQIASHSPTGPILLAGYSFGGIVGFAVATRLREAGCTVCFLGLLDIEAQPGIATGARRRRMTRRRELAGFIAALQRGEGSSKLAYVISRRLISPRWKPALRLVAAIPRTWWSGNFPPTSIAICCSGILNPCFGNGRRSTRHYRPWMHQSSCSGQNSTMPMFRFILDGTSSVLI